MAFKSIWLLHNNAAGNAQQCINLAQALGDLVPDLQVSHKAFRLKRPYLWLPPELTPRSTAIAEPDWSRNVSGDRLPDMIIACGRQSAPVAFSIKTQSGGRTKHIQILDPGSVRDEIDLLIVPEHDHIKGTDVLTTLGSLTPAKLEQIAHRFTHLPKPLYGVLVGGSDRKHRYSKAESEALFEQIAALAEAGKSLVITTSRRTDGLITGLLAQLGSFENVEFWHPQDSDTANPYKAILNEADMFLVTPDSVNMVCEAARTGKGIMLLGDADKVTSKKKQLHKNLEKRDILRTFDPDRAPWAYEKLAETERVAQEIVLRFG